MSGRTLDAAERDQLLFALEDRAEVCSARAKQEVAAGGSGDFWAEKAGIASRLAAELGGKNLTTVYVEFRS